ncbi:IS110 family transposase [Tissierella carlieri]|jgi:transposase|uniref:IS110 family transposase n=1 Tax=Tissierella carlieri TaxID=689904 RepID=UPI001C0F5664|nr:IS110 family transposase [Tissierella carlieri]MBU5313272.1 IS110 family transposase [Tissierella carlieri]MDU5158283.1 IS110 family transposase [Citrobacter sp.]
MFYVGIDIAKKNHEASIIDSNGKLLDKSITFSNSESGSNKLLSLLNKFEADSSNVIIGMEATGHYWLSLYSHLLNLGFTVYVINPIQSEAFRKMYIRQTKNDSKDSFIIAQIMRFGEFSTTSLADEDIMALRQLSRYRFSLVDECSDWKRKCIALLDQVFPEYSKLFSDTFGVTSRELLSNYPTPEDILSIDTDTLSKLLSAASRGRFGISKASEIQEIASNTFGISFAKDAFTFQIKQIIAQINFIEGQLKDLENEIATLLHRTNQIITTITGIGDILGAVIIGEIGDISRFESASQLVAYAGLDASVKQSGDFIGTHTKISKRGSPYLRRAIWLAATVAAFKDPALSLYYQSLRARGKHHLTAIGAVARKVCNIIFAVLSNNKPYVPNIN